MKNEIFSTCRVKKIKFSIFIHIYFLMSMNIKLKGNILEDLMMKIN